MYLYPESMTMVARYLLPELGEAACCLNCRQKLHPVDPVAIHRLCGIVLCGDCYGKALVDYHSSPLVGRTPPSCPSCHHYLTEENLNLTLPPLRYAVQDSLSFLTGQRWQRDFARQETQQAPTQVSCPPYGFGQVYEPVLFGGRNAVGEEFHILPDGTAVRAEPTPQPVHFVQMQQILLTLAERMNANNKRLDDIEGWQGNGSFGANKGRNNWQNQNQNQNQNNYNNNNSNNNQNNNNNNNNNNNKNNQNQNGNNNRNNSQNQNNQNNNAYRHKGKYNRR